MTYYSFAEIISNSVPEPRNKATNVCHNMDEDKEAQRVLNVEMFGSLSPPPSPQIHERNAIERTIHPLQRRHGSLVDVSWGKQAHCRRPQGLGET